MQHRVATHVVLFKRIRNRIILRFYVQYFEIFLKFPIIGTIYLRINNFKPLLKFKNDIE